MVIQKCRPSLSPVLDPSALSSSNAIPSVQKRRSQASFNRKRLCDGTAPASGSLGPGSRGIEIAQAGSASALNSASSSSAWWPRIQPGARRGFMENWDFFTVPTLTFGVLYCFFVIAHDRRRILHCNVAKHPSSGWVTQQLREAFPYDSAPGYLIFDHGADFNEEVIDTVKSFGIQPKRTSFRSPWISLTT